ncbi:hypothetical protein QBC39DRAFT_162838 [Podospora conica]|nr:hypothetical protein QBC39DRAFT_162838 [Schizothecium conicum]
MARVATLKMASAARGGVHTQARGQGLGAQQGHTRHGDGKIRRVRASRSAASTAQSSPFRPALALPQLAIAPSPSTAVAPRQPPSPCHGIAVLPLTLCTARRWPGRILSALPSPPSLRRRHRSASAPSYRRHRALAQPPSSRATSLALSTTRRPRSSIPSFVLFCHSFSLTARHGLVLTADDSVSPCRIVPGSEDSKIKSTAGA